MVKGFENKNFEVYVYKVGNRITLDGLDKSVKGMYALEIVNGGFHFTRANEKEFAKQIIHDLKYHVKLDKVDSVKINYNNSKNVIHSMDGYFGRPVLFTGTTKLSPITGKKKANLKYALKDFENFELDGGKIVKLIF